MDTATVTTLTLTAEVKVLKIGSRQVTLNIYRQIDRVEIKEIEPFGRIRDSRDQQPGTYVIGRCIKTGALVRSFWGGHPGMLDLDECMQIGKKLDNLDLIVL